MNRLLAGLFLLFLFGCPTPETTPLPELGDCPTSEDFFAVRIQSELFEQNCLYCHIQDGPAGHTGFVLEEPGSTEGWLSQNYELARSLALTEEEDGLGSLLLLKPTARHSDGHGGGEVLTPDSPAYTALLEFVGRVRGEIDDCGNGDTEGPGFKDCEGGEEAGPRLLRRLTHREYEASLSLVLGAEHAAGVSDEFAVDNEVHGFINNAAALQLSPLLFEQYQGAAERIAEAWTMESMAAALSCSAARNEACARSFIADYGLRLFRRPLRDDEIDQYVGLWRLVSDEDGFESGIQWVLTALLQSPHFLYRSELGALVDDGMFALSAWELAAQLSFLVVGHTPDDELLASAADGRLGSAEGLAEQLNRLRGHQDTVSNLQSFFAAWLQWERLPFVPRDPELYPELTPEIRAAMIGESERLVADVYHQGGGLAALLEAEESWMTDELASYYGLSPGTGAPDAEGFRRVQRDERWGGGLLSHGSLLTTHALPTGSSPIHRGLFVRERLLCQELPPPPANLDTSPPPVDPSLSTRDRYAAHSSQPACAGCHELIDPIGFSFEHYDGGGRWRETDGPHAIDATGYIVSSSASNGDFTGVEGLAAQLADGPDLSSCYAQQWLRYGTGLDETGSLACSVAPLAQAISGADGLGAIFDALASMPHFWMRTGEPGEQDGPAAGGTPLPTDPGDEPGDDDDDPLGDDDDGGPPGDDDDDSGPPGGGTIPEGLAADVSYASDWGGGYCADVLVTNRGDGPVDWVVELPFDGMLTTVWNADHVELGGGLFRFMGPEWSSSLLPEQTTQFGLCGQR